jgi:gamma-glutamyltranspeptidase/glutathione hydrolase
MKQLNNRYIPRLFRAVALIAVMTAPTLALAQAQPEIHTGFQKKEAVRAKSFMISAANPHASRAGYAILERGGSAADAAIAAALMLTLVEPQASGIGGGGYMLHWSQTKKTLDAYDAAVAAPKAVKPDHFLDSDGDPVKRSKAGFGGRTVGVPGQLRLFAEIHAKHGKLPWQDLFQPTIALAEKGFSVSPRLHKQTHGKRKKFTDPTATSYFLDADGEAWPVGHILVNKPLADTLRQIAERGVDAFYTGPIAQDIAAAVTNASEYPFPMTAEEIAAYRIKPHAPICTTYRQHRVCGVGPSTTGGLTVAMTLRLLEPFDLAGLGPDSPDAIHLFLEASKLAYADRSRYIGDPDFVPVPVAGLLDHAYLAERAKKIDPASSMGRPSAGLPPMRKAWNHAPDDTPESPSTTHLTAIDKDGNAVSFTTTIGRGFGSGIMTRGFLLNDQLLAFSFRPTKDGDPVANAPAGGKRPRSSMSPTILFRPDGRVRLVVGSPGGTRIIGYVTKTIVAVLDWNAAPNWRKTLWRHASPRAWKTKTIR